MFKFDKLNSISGNIFGYSVGLMIVSVILVTGCAGSPSETAGDGTLSVGLSVGGQQNASPAAIAVIDSITLTSAQVSIGRIRIKSVSEIDSLDFRSDNPLVVNLNLDNSIQYIGTIPIRSGVYDETLFRIKRIDSADGQVYLDNPELRDNSIIATGYMNGFIDSTFVWKTDLNVNQVNKIVPFTVNPGDTVNLIFQLDVSKWFVSSTGGKLDPRTAINAGNVKAEIDNNIKNEFKVTTF